MNNYFLVRKKNMFEFNLVAQETTHMLKRGEPLLSRRRRRPPGRTGWINFIALHRRM